MKLDGIYVLVFAEAYHLHRELLELLLNFIFQGFTQARRPPEYAFLSVDGHLFGFERQQFNQSHPDILVEGMLKLILLHRNGRFELHLVEVRNLKAGTLLPTRRKCTERMVVLNSGF